MCKTYLCFVKRFDEIRSTKWLCLRVSYRHVLHDLFSTQPCKEVCVCVKVLRDVLCRLHGVVPRKTVVSKLRGRIRHCWCGTFAVVYITRLEIASACKLSDRLKILLRCVETYLEFPRRSFTKHSEGNIEGSIMYLCIQFSTIKIC